MPSSAACIQTTCTCLEKAGDGRRAEEEGKKYEISKKEKANASHFPTLIKQLAHFLFEIKTLRIERRRRRKKNTHSEL